MNINRDLVLKRFDRLDILLEKLREIKDVEKKKFLNDLTLQLSAQRALVVSINICIDIGAHILSLNKSGKPETYSEIFENLSNLEAC